MGNDLQFDPLLMDDVDLQPIEEEKNEYLIANNPLDSAWIEQNETSYKNTKSSINYDCRMYISLPFDAQDILKSNAKKLTELKPLNQFDRLSEERKQRISELQRECTFLLIRHFCVKVIERRNSIPSFIKLERLYQRFFAAICSDYLETRIDCDDETFETFIFRLREIEFTSSNASEQ